MQTKVWTRETIHALLDTNAAAVAKAVLAIYARQTAGEQAVGSTTDHNGRGFSAMDAEFLSDIAVKLPRYGMRFTESQLKRVRPLMKRYWRQLLEIAEEQGREVSYKAAKPVAQSSNREIAEEPPASEPMAVAAYHQRHRPSRGELARMF